jgi:hypothetical protein
VATGVCLLGEPGDVPGLHESIRQCPDWDVPNSAR